MRWAIREVCLGLLLLSPFSARAELIRGGGSVTDVGPEAGIVYGGGQAFLFRNREEVLATSGRAGIYKTSTSGENWVRAEHGLRAAFDVEPHAAALCQSLSAPEVAYVVTLMDGISGTADFGESWQPLAATTNPYLYDCAVDPLDPAVVYALAQNTDPSFPGLLFKSTDAGRTFSAVGTGLPELQAAYALAVAPTNPLTVYVGDSAPESFGGGLYVSSDGGLNFRRLQGAPDSVLKVYPYPTEDGTLLVLTYERCFLSTDGGASFAQVGGGLPVTASTSLAFDPTNPSVVYGTAGPLGLFRSSDGARTFERLGGPSEDLLLGLGAVAVGVSPGDADHPPIIYVGTSLGPVRSDDSGQTFVPIHNGYRGTQVNDLAIDAAGRLLVATVNSVGVFRSTSPGVYQMIGDTLPREAATYLQAVAAAPDDPEVYLVGGGAANDSYTGGGGVFRTTDGGRSWSRSIISGPPFSPGRMHIGFAPSDARRVYMVQTLSGSLYRSTDGGQSFDRLPSDAMDGLAVDPRNPDVVYVGTRSSGRGLFKSTDGGRSLQQLSASGNFGAIAIDPENPQIVYAGSRFAGVIRSRDGGGTFLSVSFGLRGDRVLGLGVDPSRPARLFVWTHAGGLFRSEDGADTWTAVDTGEMLRRSTAQAGQTALVVEPGDPVHVYVGNGSVLRFVNQ